MRSPEGISMAIFYTLENGGSLRYFISEAEAKAAMLAPAGRASRGGRASQGGAELAGGAGLGKGRASQGGAAKISQVEIDELIMRQWAANWANQSEVRREAAKRREASKTPEQRSEIMRKAWKKRKESE